MTKDNVYDILEPKLGHAVASKARHYFDREFFEEHKHKEKDITKPSSVLKAAFMWNKTEERYAYWFNQCNRL